MKQALSKLRILATPEGWTGTYGLFLLTVFILWVPSDGYAGIVLPKHRLFLWATGLFLLHWRPWRCGGGGNRRPGCAAPGLSGCPFASLRDFWYCFTCPPWLLHIPARPGWGTAGMRAF